jgi:transcription elongation factor Elf1
MWKLSVRNLVDLSHPVDVYSDWIDACDEIANPKPAKRASSQRRELQRGSGNAHEGRGQSDESGGGGGGGGGGDGGLSDLEDEDLEDDDEDMRLNRGGGKRQTVLSDDDDEEDF